MVSTVKHARFDRAWDGGDGWSWPADPEAGQRVYCRKGVRMSRIEEKCHGQSESLMCSSASLSCPTRVYKFVWRLRNNGLHDALAMARLRIRRFLASGAKSSIESRKSTPCQAEAPELQPGDWVRVRSREEIRVMLDRCERLDGLAWMTTMEKCCGREFQVRRRVRKIVLESTGEIRKLKNTVLLEGGICDGIYGCDRSCFFFWKEAWLERVHNHE